MPAQGAVINIAGTTPIDDPEYRYKMPSVYGKIEGRGNGIKTVIPNITDVALALHRDPGEVNKFFGCELGAQTTYNADTDRAVVNGAHTDGVLQTAIKSYIDIFVLCPNCGLPETDYKIKSGCIYHKCMACGSKEMVDMNHKLCNYILAQDKKAKADKKKADKGKDKKAKGGDDEKKKKKKKDKAEDGSDDGEKKKKSKKDKKDKKKKSKKDKSPKNGSDADDVADEVEELSIASGDAIDDAAAMDLAIEGTRKFLEENPDASPSEIAEVIVNQQMASGLKSHDKIHILFRSVFTIDFFKEEQVEKWSDVISKITLGSAPMERHLIGAAELLCQDKPKLFPVMLKQLFEEDALEEDVILEWACEGRSDFTQASLDEDCRAALRGEAEPVVVWLQDDDSDESDSD